MGDKWDNKRTIEIISIKRQDKLSLKQSDKSQPEGKIYLTNEWTKKSFKKCIMDVLQNYILNKYDIEPWKVSLLLQVQVYIIEELFRIFSTTSADEISLALHKDGNLIISQSRNWGNEINSELYYNIDADILKNFKTFKHHDRSVIPEQDP